MDAIKRQITDLDQQIEALRMKRGALRNELAEKAMADAMKQAADDMQDAVEVKSVICADVRGLREFLGDIPDETMILDETRFYLWKAAGRLYFEARKEGVMNS